MHLSFSYTFTQFDSISHNIVKFSDIVMKNSISWQLSIRGENMNREDHFLFSISGKPTHELPHLWNITADCIFKIKSQQSDVADMIIKKDGLFFNRAGARLFPHNIFWNHCWLPISIDKLKAGYFIDDRIIVEADLNITKLIGLRDTGFSISHCFQKISSSFSMSKYIEHKNLQLKLAARSQPDNDNYFQICLLVYPSNTELIDNLSKIETDYKAKIATKSLGDLHLVKEGTAESSHEHENQSDFMKIDLFTMPGGIFRTGKNECMKMEIEISFSKFQVFGLKSADMMPYKYNYMIRNVSEEANKPDTSHHFTTGPLRWKILINPNENRVVRLQAIPGIDAPKSWSINADCEIMVKSAEGPKSSVIHNTYNMNFHSKGNSDYCVLSTYSLPILDTLFKIGSVQLELGLRINQVMGFQCSPLCDFRNPNLENSDLIIYLQTGEILFSHSQILCIHSCVFKNIIQQSTTSEQDKKVLSLDDCNTTEFYDFLSIIYNFDFIPNENNVEAMLYLAEKYQVETVKNAAEKFLTSYEISDLTEETILLLAYRYNLFQIQIMATKFVLTKCQLEELKIHKYYNEMREENKNSFKHFIESQCF